MDFSIGQGYDVHPLAEGHALVLGGVSIDHPKGLKGHSDADVLLHAIADALLGAANLGDIGKHFPPHDPAYENSNSLDLLAEANRMVKEAGFTVGNIDSTLCLQAPKIQPYIPDMQQAISNCLDIPAAHISVKATTTENLGPEGREEGISAHAVVLLLRAKNVEPRT